MRSKEEPMRRGAKPTKPKVEAKSPVARKSLKNEGSRVRDLEKCLAESLEREKVTGEILQGKNRALTEALEQQRATSEILRVMSSAHTDAQLVFDTTVQSAVRLCNAANAAVFRTDGRTVYEPANYGSSPEALAAMRARYPRPLNMETTAGIAILTRSVVEIPDIEDPSAIEFVRQSGRLLGFRSEVTVPMLREGEAVGAITVARREPGRFSDAELELLKTFADQAVIAIENVRLFKELEARNAEVTEALEQQTATSEILRVISRSGTDVKPVFDAIAESARRLLRGWGALVVRLDGQLLHAAAISGGVPGSAEGLRELFPTSAERGTTLTGDAILDREVKFITDVETDEMWAGMRARAGTRGWRANLAVPMLQDGQPIGAITVTRAEPGPFAPQDIELLKTFADQAVIAIENARLLNELQQRTRELACSVEQLTALGEVGRAVSSTLDLETVLTTIVSRAVQLSGLDGGVVFEYDEATEEFVQRAATEQGGALALARRATRIRKGEGLVGRTAITLEPVQGADISAAGADESRLRDNLIESGIRGLLAVPMVREGQLIGSLVVSRNAAGAFSPETVDLLRTFATQSALAIQNARLFREIQDKSRQLEIASQHKSEFLASMAHELRTPLNAIIGFSDVLLQGMFGETSEKQTEYLRDILASGQHLLSLINDILDLSKIEAGRMELDLAAFDLPTAIDNAMILMRERAARRGIALERHVDERVAEIRADERKVKQVLLNVLSNAVKFTPEGGRIEVRAALADGMAEISVTDTGIGIAPEHHDAVFEEFCQVGKADKKAEGTGLGLALCRKFVELHGGRIGVKSEVGVGSTFTFTLPVRCGE
ncbi:MAG: GAF domain-containing protein [Candidatus Rokubacteria bacterium]|nr:GAF domain-containing protein [Candidatus Rokubacteria bacterium]